MGLINTLDMMKAQEESPVKACTSLPQQWHKPRGAKIKAVPISTVVVAKAKKDRKRNLLTATTQGAGKSNITDTGGWCINALFTTNQVMFITVSGNIKDYFLFEFIKKPLADAYHQLIYLGFIHNQLVLKSEKLYLMSKHIAIYTMFVTIWDQS